MCFSATASFSASAVLITAGGYAFYLSRRLEIPWWQLFALVPVFFGVQQAMEGSVWLLSGAGQVECAVPFALGFHFFSHFLWLWWLPLASYLVEPGRLRRWLFGGCTLFGLFAGTLVLAVMLLHSEWLAVGVKGGSITYKFHTPWQSADLFGLRHLPAISHLPIRPAALYAFTILLPLLLSSHRHVRVFGVLAALASVFTSEFYQYAYVSVWCFFAALLSLYLVFMIRQLALGAAK
jgi:hypothetical protein